VIPVKEQVDMVVKVMIKTMISSRSLQMDFLQDFVGDDGKGGEEVEIKAAVNVSAQANLKVPGFQIRQFWIWLWYATCCLINSV
jgi:hypothetical protein